MRCRSVVPLAVIVAWLATLANVAHGAETADVFIDDPARLTRIDALENNGITVRVYDVGAKARLERALSQNLPADQEKAKPIVRDRIRALDDGDRQRLMDAHQAVLTAQRLGITETPAVVFYGTHVVYGVSDLADALARLSRVPRGPGHGSTRR